MISLPLRPDPPDLDSLCAVVVTYHPDNGLEERVRRITAQVARVLIVDNGSGPEVLQRLQALSEGGTGRVTLSANPENRGIAAALNQGAQWAIAAGFGWMLTFDQDTVVSEVLTTTLVRAARDFAARSLAAQSEPLAAAAANYREAVNRRPGYPADELEADREWVEVSYAITSGCLLSLVAYKALGPFREDFFIDYVDVEYSFRARAGGYRLLATRAFLMEHAVGAPEPHWLLGRNWWTSNYAAWRWYHRTRNLTLTSLAFFLREPEWIREAWLNLLLTTLKILAFEPQKAAKIQNMLRGLGHGLRDTLKGHSALKP